MAWQVHVDDATAVSVVLDAPERPRSDAVILLGHGAGGHMADRTMLATAATLTRRGLPVLRFNFGYREQGRKLPDRMPALEACFDALVQHVRRELAPKRLVIGGRSMGGRVASMLAARGCPCDGVLLLAYPLHPAGQPSKLRHAHLAAIASPVLCCNGTRDALCERALMDDVVSRLGPNWRMHWIEGADHAFHVPRASGRVDAEVMDEVGAMVETWLAEAVTAAPGATALPRPSDAG